MVELDDNDKGYIAVGIAIIFFGSFALPMKSKRVQEASVDPVVFQLYYSFAIFVTSWLACIYEPFAFDYHGILAALLWVPASILSIFAINFIGLSVAQGLWSGVTIVVSFIWGRILQSTPMKLYWAVLSMAFLLLGIVLISFCKNRHFFRGPITAPSGYHTINESDPLYTTDNADGKPAAPPKDNKIAGFICAIVLGVLNGSMLVPTLHLNVSAYQFIPNFGIGALLVTPVFAIAYFAIIKKEMPQLKVQVTAIPGLVAGVLWNIGNVGSVIATLYLGLSIGFPLSQLALLVAGLWGLLLFKEFPFTLQKVQFFISAGVLIFGAFCLLMAGEDK